MDRLTSQKVERLRVTLKLLTDYDSSVNEDEVDALCDLALSALSQEAVRDEALEEAAKVCDALLAEGNAPSDRLIGFQLTAELIRALKREPNAAAQAPLPARLGSDAKVDSRQVESATDASAYPAPAAPDVAEVLSDWRVVAEFFASRNWPDTKLGDAASRLHARLPALLAKLGQGWIPVSERLPECDEVVIVQGGIARHNGKEWKTLTCEPWPGRPIQWEVTHWMPLPPTPGASDD